MKEVHIPARLLNGEQVFDELVVCPSFYQWAEKITVAAEVTQQASLGINIVEDARMPPNRVAFFSKGQLVGFANIEETP